MIPHNERIDMILRLGCSAEVADLYDRIRVAVRTHRKLLLPTVKDYTNMMMWIAEAYDRVEIAYSDAEQALDDFKKSDGTPAELESTAGLNIKQSR